ncbi:MAG: glycosyltransferase [Promethearchaeota archaeon]
MNILIVDQSFNSHNIGGAFKSNYSIISELVKKPDCKVRVLARNTNLIMGKKFSSKRINPIIKTPFKKLNMLIDFLRINQYLSFFPLFIEIRKFKPDIIIVQRDLTFATLLVTFFKKLPVINIIRDGMSFCPKYIDIIQYYQNCIGALNREKCWECIDRWQSLRIFLSDNFSGSANRLFSLFYTLYYKINYFITKFYMNLIKYASINVVASPLMKKVVKEKSKKSKVIITKITPIEIRDIVPTLDGIDENIKNKIKSAKNKILYVIPRNEGGSKGFPFVKKLIKVMGNDYLFIVVGTLLKELDSYKNVINIGKIPTKNLFALYQDADLTIVPSIYNEAFGRVILESILNNTPVIISPQCGANYLFKNRSYVSVIPLKVNLWFKEIQFKLQEKNVIPELERLILEKKFSPDSCTQDLLNIIEKLL